MLTNGIKWRIYDVKANSPYETFIEVDLTRLITDSLDNYDNNHKAFMLFFEANTFFIESNQAESIIEKYFKDSEKEIEKQEKIIKDKIEGILTEICYGFKNSIGKSEYSKEDRQQIFEDAIILLYRLLFIQYAEARELLPVSNDIYAESSLNHLAEEARNLCNNGKIVEISDEYFLWEKFDSLRGYINVGWEDINMVAYNGGLFDNDQRSILRDYSLKNSFFAVVLSELSYIKNKSGKYEDKIEYRDLSVRNLGSLYEGLLEYNLFIAEEPLVRRKTNGKIQYVKVSETTIKKNERHNIIETDQIYFSQNATERKETGSYYTPEDVVNYIISNTLGKKLEEIRDDFYQLLSKEKELLKYTVTQNEVAVLKKQIDLKIIRFIEKRVLKLSVLDSSMGSGHFLVNATHYLANFVLELIQSTEWENEEIPSSISHWKIKVVSNCIYGVDINPLAVHLGKLSLWLISAAENKPLTFIDHHLKTGNSLLGITKQDIELKISEMTKNEYNLFTSTYNHMLNNAMEKYEELESMPEHSKDEVHLKKDKYEEIKQELKILKYKYDLFLAMLLSEGNINEEEYLDVLSLNDIRLLEKKVTQNEKYFQIISGNHIFHWELEFPEIITKGGFDVVIGNPPYVVISDKALYKYTVNNTLETGNLYSFMIEKAIHFTGQLGKFGMIIPISAIAGESMRSLQSYMLENLGELWVSSFSTRPSKLFPKVEQRLAIVLGSKKGINKEPCNVYTTSYIKWFSHERDNLFSSIRYSYCDQDNISKGIIPKIGNEIENKIFSRIKNNKNILSDLLCTGGIFKLYYHSAPRYWNKAFNNLPKFYSEKNGYGRSTKYKELTFDNDIYQAFVSCVLNSGLFYWWWNVVSDCRDLTKRDITNFPINISRINDLGDKLKDVFCKLNDTFSKNKVSIQMNLGGKIGLVTLDSVNHQKTKSVIDEIDVILGEMYGFDLDEIKFIQEYDLRFRMGSEEVEND